MASSSSSTKERLLAAAERLFAAHGLDGVSLRQISAASGNGNNSAVQYHFRTKAELVRAIFDHRMPSLNARQMMLIAQQGPTDLRSWVECCVLPFHEQAEGEGSHYLRFVAMMEQHHRNVLANLPYSYLEATGICLEQIMRLLSHIPEPVRTDRLAQALVFSLAASANRERARENGETALPFAAHLGNLLDGLVAFLEAPASPATSAALRDGPGPDRSSARPAPTSRPRGAHRPPG